MKFGLVGKSLQHSFSKKYFSEKFLMPCYSKYSYSIFELKNISELLPLVSGDILIKGLNVTVPYKELVIKYLDEMDDVAGSIGAVNVISIKRFGDSIYLTGHNTDAKAFELTLAESLNHLKQDGDYLSLGALVLGSGGSAKAVIYSLKRMGIPCLQVSRIKKGDVISYDELSPEIISKYLLMINTTPLGMFPKLNDKPKLPYEGISDKHILYDLIYNPQLTAFLKEGTKRGAHIINGLRMLYTQAELSWKIWNSI